MTLVLSQEREVRLLIRDSSNEQKSVPTGLTADDLGIEVIGEGENQLGIRYEPHIVGSGLIFQEKK